MFGGTVFVGWAIVEAALKRGHAATLWGRGRTGAELFPDVPRLLGYRDSGDYRSLPGRRWDAVVDVGACVPRHLRQVATALGAPSAGRYLLISTCSVYDYARAEPATLADLVDACAAAAAAGAGWFGDLERVTVGADLDLPLVLDPGTPWVVHRRDASAASAAGLTVAPLDRTAADVLAWDEERGLPPLKAGPSEEQLEEALAPL